MTKNRHNSSFRDPSGYVFLENGELYRRINKTYFEDFELIHSTGLYKELLEKGLIIDHQIINENDEYKVIKPRKIAYISYPYEWSFAQYVDAALLTLEITRLALNYGMILKDASAYNIQFNDGRAVFIDTLSFTKYEEDTPWVAYGQFCRHFLAPLALMAYCDLRLSQLMRIYLDGIPLDMAIKLLPFKARLNLGINLHVYAHAKKQLLHGNNTDVKINNIRLPKKSLIAILDNLYTTINNLTKRQSVTEWAAYYDNMHNYTEESFEMKKKIVKNMLIKVNPSKVCDIGANTGAFSSIAAEVAKLIVAYDIDYEAVDKHYCVLKASNNKNILPLVVDISNPSPSQGWNLSERMSLFERGRFDCVMALAIIHHICISGNVPLDMAAEFFSRLGDYLIIEFVPKTDSQVRKLLATREDIFPSYTKQGFEESFALYFDILEVSEIVNSERIIYLMRKQPERA